ncbi:MAG: DNA-deoxyinosine glycosylase [Candidatus Krumholzibacteriota bacterium]|nr:DNA-deoxyinosine glycosylase [Candidatus Krumholzibacteriota bacterium]
MKITSFEPIIAPDTRILILGTMPSEASLRAGEYYAHPRNAFWRIMSELFGFPGEAGYRERVKGLKSQGVSVWDVLQACERAGSLDASIQMRTAEPNDFRAFLAEHPGVQRICFNGQKAAELFTRLVLPHLPHTDDVPDLLVLPSTSPANAQLTYEQKVSQWKKIKEGP